MSYYLSQIYNSSKSEFNKKKKKKYFVSRTNISLFIYVSFIPLIIPISLVFELEGILYRWSCTRVNYGWYKKRLPDSHRAKIDESAFGRFVKPERWNADGRVVTDLKVHRIHASRTT